jgi:uncharacterized protein (DUF2141 family)
VHWLSSLTRVCRRVPGRPALSIVALAGLLGVAPAATSVAAAEPASADCTGHPSNTKLYVVVQRVRSSKGLIAVTLYADIRSKFLAKRGSLYVGRVSATAPTTRACIYVPAPGIYGLVVYHDENANRWFDRSIIGLPTEGAGFSNNPSTFLGLPAFSAVRLNVPHTNMETTVRLRYP